ncbi:MAG: hypothetical protein V3S16_16615, partial [Candidatus Desulfatibia sp.]|uniref:hypothetical protein n=1 Tax=Candidatus Desulfatibia sp. TaxID=3101189 RepID=UPI002F2FC2D3
MIYYSLFVFRFSRITRWGVFAVIVILYYPIIPGFSWTSMRMALGILSIALYLHYVTTLKITPLILSGTVSAIALFTSQEIGASAFLSIGTGMILLGWKNLSFKRVFFQAGFYISGIIPICAMVFLFFYLQNSLADFLTGFV